jgi:hypothetical protein
MADKLVLENDRSNDWITDEALFTVIFAVAFISMIAARSLELLLPWKWAGRFGSAEKRWFIGRAWEDANTFAELSFMG